MHTQTIHKPIRSICFGYCGTRTHQNPTPLDYVASSTAVPIGLWLQENFWSSDTTHWIIPSFRGILCTNLATDRTKESAPVWSIRQSFRTPCTWPRGQHFQPPLPGVNKKVFIWKVPRRVTDSLIWQWVYSPQGYRWSYLPCQQPKGIGKTYEIRTGSYKTPVPPTATWTLSLWRAENLYYCTRIKIKRLKLFFCFYIIVKILLN